MTTKKSSDLDRIFKKSAKKSIEFSIYALIAAYIQVPTSEFIFFCAISILWYITAAYAVRKNKQNAEVSPI